MKISASGTYATADTATSTAKKTPGRFPALAHQRASAGIAAGLCFVLACAGGCFFVIASSLRFGLTRSAALDSLSTNAYSLYLVHYVPTVWLQYALLGAPLFALVKGIIVFCGSVIVSWLAILLYERIPFGVRLIFTRSRGAAAE